MQFIRLVSCIASLLTATGQGLADSDCWILRRHPGMSDSAPLGRGYMIWAHVSFQIIYVEVPADDTKYMIRNSDSRARLFEAITSPKAQAISASARLVAQTGDIRKLRFCD